MKVRKRTKVIKDLIQATKSNKENMKFQWITCENTGFVLLQIEYFEHKYTQRERKSILEMSLFFAKLLIIIYN